MQDWWIAAAVGSAFAFGASTHLKHLSAADVPDAQTMQLTALGRFVRATLTHRLWLGGIGADLVGVLLQLVALHLGPLAAFQPLLILALLFALLLGQSHRGRLRLDELGWVLLVTASLAGFLLLSGTAGSGRSTADAGPAIGAGAAGLVLAVTCVLLGGRQRGGGRTAATLGITVGIVYASSAALLKALTDIAVAHTLELLSSWQLYAVLVLGAAGLLLNQLAFQAGPLTASLPAMSTIDPLLSIVIGIWIFDEHLRHGAGIDTALAALLLASAPASSNSPAPALENSYRLGEHRGPPASQTTMPRWSPLRSPGDVRDRGSTRADPHARTEPNRLCGDSAWCARASG